MSSSTVPSPVLNPPVRLAATRVVVIRVLYGALSLWAVVMASFGPAMLVSGSLPAGGWRFAAASTAAWKLLTVGPALVVAWRAGRSVLAVRALVVGQLCWLVAALLAPEDGSSAAARVAQAVVSLLIWVGPWLLLAPRRSQLWRQRFQADRGLLAAGLLALLPLLSWAVAGSHLDVSGSTPELPLRELRFDMVGLPLALAATALLAALHRERWWASAVALAWVGVGTAAMMFAHDWASPGRAAGAVVVLAGAVLALRARTRLRG